MQWGGGAVVYIAFTLPSVCLYFHDIERNHSILAWEYPIGRTCVVNNIDYCTS